MPTYSLYNHSTMVMTAMASLSEELSNSIDYDNTYLYSEETSRFDDIISLTSITSNVIREFQATPQDTSLHSDMNVFQSDTDDTSEAVTSAVQSYGDGDQLDLRSDSL
jgi:uncharacterized protein (DUF1810 family)